MSSPPRLAFFGGTFDPIHLGHLEIAREARAALQLDQVIFLPCRQSPHKTTKPGASDQERLEMIQMATRDLPWAKVSSHELEKPPPSYTSQTVQELRATLPINSRIFLILGLDQWESLPKWHQPERLARELEFIVIGRNGQATPRAGYRAHFLHGDHPASSSEIRADLAQGRQARWLPEKVRTFLTKKGLYSDIA